MFVWFWGEEGVKFHIVLRCRKNRIDKYKSKQFSTKEKEKREKLSFAYMYSLLYRCVINYWLYTCMNSRFIPIAWLHAHREFLHSSIQELALILFYLLSSFFFFFFFFFGIQCLFLGKRSWENPWKNEFITIEHWKSFNWFLQLRDQ